tara:strand:+ start:63358 stop:63711 length:354 start_codon:yes stop_codon:yes gene_type:complete
MKSMINLEGGYMQLHIHNNASIKYSKLVTLVNMISRMRLKKFKKMRDWKLELWISDNNDEASTIDCGVALVRPNHSTVYTKKRAASFKHVIHSCLKDLENNIREERNKWKRRSIAYS